MSDRGELAGTSWAPETARNEEEENEITLPLRVMSSREPHATVRKPHQRLHEQEAESEIQRTPDWTEIGDPTA